MTVELAPFRSLSEFERLKQGCATGRPVPSESTLVIGFWGVMQSLPFRSLSECERLKRRCATALSDVTDIDLPDAVLADAADSEPFEVMEDVDAVEVRHGSVRVLTHCSKSQKH
jgi:hypothetical protein